MKILISSHAFAPSVGGIETVSAILAREWSAAGHAVTITTETPGDDTWENLRVLRSPERAVLRRHIAKADLYFQNHISLRSLLPAFGLKTPVAVLHQTYLWPWNKRAGLAGIAKWLMARRLRNLAISRAVATALPANTPIVGNPYDAATFQLLPEVERGKEFLFVGRFVSDKGIGLLLEAMRFLHARKPEPGPLRLTLVGGGPDEASLRAEVAAMGLGHAVTFAGPKTGHALAREYNAHRVLVVPSLWPEPFGIVALEGAGCGCYVIGSSAGGLSEAIGPAGRTFPNGNAEALAESMATALEDNDLPAGEIQRHLEPFAPATYAAQILKLALLKR
ncbi:MAG: glycosyltransferase family 4 protein [Opitutales bacterium]|nr:glycosyltransferase family 4 protein [Opitutales bacterium]